LAEKKRIQSFLSFLFLTNTVTAALLTASRIAKAIHRICSYYVLYYPS
jgi:hypothetical protein